MSRNSANDRLFSSTYKYPKPKVENKATTTTTAADQLELEGLGSPNNLSGAH